MQTTLTHILKRMKNYDERMWATDKISEAKLATEYEIIHRIEELREIHNSFLARWMLTMHEVDSVSNRSLFKAPFFSNILSYHFRSFVG
jgi:hypothetical protein